MSSLWPSGGVEGRTGIEFQRHLYRGEINVLEFAAVGGSLAAAEAELATDGTAAIQAALEAAKPIANMGARVVIPTLSTRLPVKFSNLTMYAYTCLEGPFMSQGVLSRITGSTGPAIREKTSAEGNAAGASGLWIRNMLINGNGTAGDGVYLGWQVPNFQLNFNAGMSHVHVRNFASGKGMYLNCNGVQLGYLWSNSNLIGVQTAGAGSQYAGLWAEFNTQNDVVIGSFGDTFDYIQIESADVATEMLRVTGTQSNVKALYMTISGVAKRNLAVLASGALQNSFDDVTVSLHGGSATWDHTIYFEPWSNGTGALSRTHLIQTESAAPVIYYDLLNNTSTKVGAQGVTKTVQAIAFVSGSWQPNVATGEIKAVSINSSATQNILAPLNGVSGSELTFVFFNNTAGAVGTISWNAVFLPDGAFAAPAAGAHKAITFIDDGTNWIEKSRSG